LRIKLVAIGWVCALLFVSAWLVVRSADRQVINSDIMALLPHAERDPVINKAVKGVTKRFERRLALLVGADDLDAAIGAARYVSNRLKRTGEFSELTLKYEENLVKRAFSFYRSLRFRILGNAARDQLLAGDMRRFERDILKRYFSTKSMVNSSMIGFDPLLLLPQFLKEREGEAKGRPKMERGYLTVKADKKVYVVVIGKLSGSPFSYSVQQKLMPLLEGFKTDLPGRFAGSDFVMAGALPHAAAGTKSGIHEMSTVGLGSLLGIVVMLIALFRSARPFVLTLTAIALGCVGGFAACLLIFGEVHLLTLIFGSSLVGISVDYSLHYFCERFRFGTDWSPSAALRHILPGISLGLVTSVIGFTGLFFAPFSGMQGMAVFSSVGLLIAYGCVALCYPLLTQNLPPPKLYQPLNWMRCYGRFWHQAGNRRTWIVIAGFGIFAVLGCSRLNVSDDIRLLQSPTASVAADEVRVRELIGRDLSSQFFLIEGSDEAEFLAMEEQLTSKLRAYQRAGKLTGYLAISDFVPSPARQKANLILYEKLIITGNNTLTRISETIGLPDDAQAAYRAALIQAKNDRPLEFKHWLSHPVSEAYRYLWLGKTERGVIGVVGLRGVYDLNVLRDLGENNSRIHFIDPAGEISGLFGEYRRQTIWLTLFSYAVVLLLLMLRYGVRGGVMVMLPPVIAAATSLSVLGLLGEPISMFNVMALLLVLGIGVDYALFYRETGVENPETLLAIALSSLTTLLAFGLLALSATAAIHSFGLTILVGILVAFFLSPMAGMKFLETSQKLPADKTVQ
jgi:predicted exporter